MWYILFFFQAEDGIRDGHVTGVQTCALPISLSTLVGKERSDQLPALLLQLPASGGDDVIEQAITGDVPHGTRCPGLRVPGQIGRASCRERGWLSGREGAV